MPARTERADKVQTPPGDPRAVPRDIPKGSGGTESNKDWSEQAVNAQAGGRTRDGGSRRRSVRAPLVEDEFPQVPDFEEELDLSQLPPEELLQFIMALLEGRVE